MSAERDRLAIEAQQVRPSTTLYRALPLALTTNVMPTCWDPGTTDMVHTDFDPSSYPEPKDSPGLIIYM